MEIELDEKQRLERVNHSGHSITEIYIHIQDENKRRIEGDEKGGTRGGGRETTRRGGGSGGEVVEVEVEHE